MPLTIGNLTLKPGEGDELLATRLCRLLGISSAQLRWWRLVRKALDARKKGNPLYVCTVEFSTDLDEYLLLTHGGSGLTRSTPAGVGVLPLAEDSVRVVVVGMGPAGLFASLRLVERGVKPIILERGKAVEERIADVMSFWNHGLLDVESNVQFGEGGAGTFSDGKLTTRVRDPNAGYVLEKLVSFGAPPEIRFLAKPHVGTDRLRKVLVNLRRHLLTSGADIRFCTRLTDLVIRDGQVRGVLLSSGEEIPCDAVVLAPGNSARDTFDMLHRRGVALAAKPFAVGLRVEHPQELINRIQYGPQPNPHLPPADYALTYNAADGRAVYSFCMCPGGVVMAGSSEEGGVVTNGMSDYGRNAANANSALVVSVTPADFPGTGPLAGVEFQRQLEGHAFEAGGRDYRAPAQNLLAFMGRGNGPLGASYRPGVVAADLRPLLPPPLVSTLLEGLNSFDRKMRGYISSEATLTAVETRTSSPVRIVRGDDRQSVSTGGLYPAGEGAGYAGGIMSSSLDGISVADAIADRFPVRHAAGGGEGEDE